MNSRHGVSNEEIIKKYDSMPNLNEDNPDSWLFAMGILLFSTIGLSTIFFACLSTIAGVP